MILFLRYKKRLKNKEIKRIAGKVVYSLENREMKKYLLLLIAFPLLIGCVSVPKYPYIKTSSVIDYSEFAKRGFFITEANSVSFDYTALGSVSSKVSGGYEVISETRRMDMKDDVYSQTKSGAKIKYGKYIPAYIEDALDAIHNQSIEIGANGVINLRITYPDNETVVVTGMAIKR